MKQKRLFLSINLPEKVKNDIFSITSNWPSDIYKIVKKENLHLTIFFFGYFPENKINLIREIIKEISKITSYFYIETIKIESFPLSSKKTKIIFLEIKENLKIKSINNYLKDKRKFIKNENFVLKNKKDFIPHITLGQVNYHKINELESDEILDIGDSFNLKIKINSLELMESELTNKGPKYSLIESFPLLQNNTL
jgi:RNA 2',3'-cyclic 3'-phosphodiesterase